MKPIRHIGYLVGLAVALLASTASAADPAPDGKFVSLPNDAKTGWPKIQIGSNCTIETVVNSFREPFKRATGQELTPMLIRTANPKTTIPACKRKGDGYAYSGRSESPAWDGCAEADKVVILVAGPSDPIVIPMTPLETTSQKLNFVAEFDACPKGDCTCQKDVLTKHRRNVPYGMCTGALTAEGDSDDLADALETIDDQETEIAALEDKVAALEAAQAKSPVPKEIVLSKDEPKSKTVWALLFLAFLTLVIGYQSGRQFRRGRRVEEVAATVAPSGQLLKPGDTVRVPPAALQPDAVIVAVQVQQDQRQVRIIDEYRDKVFKLAEMHGTHGITPTMPIPELIKRFDLRIIEIRDANIVKANEADEMRRTLATDAIAFGILKAVQDGTPGPDIYAHIRHTAEALRTSLFRVAETAGFTVGIATTEAEALDELNKRRLAAVTEKQEYASTLADIFIHYEPRARAYGIELPADPISANDIKNLADAVEAKDAEMRARYHSAYDEFLGLIKRNTDLLREQREAEQSGDLDQALVCKDAAEEIYQRVVVLSPELRQLHLDMTGRPWFAKGDLHLREAALQRRLAEVDARAEHFGSRELIATTMYESALHCMTDIAVALGIDPPQSEALQAPDGFTCFCKQMNEAIGTLQEAERELKELNDQRKTLVNGSGAESRRNGMNGHAVIIPIDPQAIADEPTEVATLAVRPLDVLARLPSEIRADTGEDVLAAFGLAGRIAEYVQELRLVIPTDAFRELDPTNQGLDVALEQPKVLEQIEDLKLSGIGKLFNLLGLPTPKGTYGLSQSVTA